MRVKPLITPNISFKAIELDLNAQKQSDIILNNYINANSEQEEQEAKLALYKFYTPYINKEAQKKVIKRFRSNREDFIQKLNTVLLESCISLKEYNNLNTITLLKCLNNTKVESSDIQQHIRMDFQKKGRKRNSLEETISESKRYTYLSTPNEGEIEIPKDPKTN